MVFYYRFFIQDTNRFELINNSEFGTQVDGISYETDCSLKPAHTNPYMKKDSDLVSNVKGLLKKGRKRRAGRPSNKELAKAARHEESFEEIVSSKINQQTTFDIHEEQLSSLNTNRMRNGICQCDQLITSEKNGWEGSALLNHGSVIQIGCVRFVFAIADFARDHTDASSSQLV